MIKFWVKNNCSLKLLFLKKHEYKVFVVRKKKNTDTNIYYIAGIEIKISASTFQ